MTSQDLIAKLKQYPVASISLGLALLLGAVFYFRWSGLQEQLDRKGKLDTEWAEVEENVLKNSVNLETHLEMAKQASQDVTERLIRPAELARNYQYFYRLQNVTGVKIITLQQQPSLPVAPARGASRGSSAAAAPEPLFSKVGYTMSLSGNFQQILEFLHALERGDHFYQLKNCSLQAGPPAEGLLTLNLNFDLLGEP